MARWTMPEEGDREQPDADARCAECGILPHAVDCSENELGCPDRPGGGGCIDDGDSADPACQYCGRDLARPQAAEPAAGEIETALRDLLARFDSLNGEARARGGRTQAAPEADRARLLIVRLERERAKRKQR